MNRLGDRQEIPCFVSKKELLLLMQRTGATTIKFPFGTSKTGNFGGGCMLYDSDENKLYFVVVLANENIFRIKKEVGTMESETPSETAKRKTISETGVIPDMDTVEKAFYYSVKHDGSEDKKHMKYFYLLSSWTGEFILFPEEYNLQEEGLRVGPPIYVECELAIDMMKGAQLEAAKDAFNFLRGSNIFNDVRYRL